MEENYKAYKSYVIISQAKQNLIETIARDFTITQRLSYTNEFNLLDLLHTELKNLNSLDFLILDLNAFTRFTKDKDFIAAIRSIRTLYPSLRIIIIAEGYKQGNVLLGKLFNEGIYNMISAVDEQVKIQEIKKCFSEEGMTYSNSSKFRLDEDAILQLNQNTNVVKETFIKVKRNCSVAVCSTSRHMGASTLAINLTKFISKLSNTSACYIEYNSHELIQSLENIQGAVQYKDMGKLNYKGIDMFYNPKTKSFNSVADIQKYGYEFYVYDFGAFDELSDEQRDNFLNKDLKIIVSGSQKWEETSLINTLFLIGEADNISCFLNFCPEEKQQQQKENWGDNKAKLYFMNLTYDPFEVKNQAAFNIILRPYLFESQLVEEKKKGFKKLFSSSKKQDKVKQEGKRQKKNKDKDKKKK